MLSLTLWLGPCYVWVSQTLPISQTISPDYLTCSLTLETAACLSARLGLPVEPSKVEGPATTLTFLGIEVDTFQESLGCRGSN